MRLVVDNELCEANGTCTKLAPALVRLDDHDRLEVLVEAIPPTQREAAEQAVRRCPRQALSLRDPE